MPVNHTIIAIAAAASIATAQSAPQPAQPPAAVGGTKQAAAEKKVCKYVSTGSIISKRICMTQSEWAQVEGATGGDLQSLRDRQRAHCNIAKMC